MKYVIDITEDCDYITVDDRGVINAFKDAYLKILTVLYNNGFYGAVGAEINGKRRLNGRKTKKKNRQKTI